MRSTNLGIYMHLAWKMSRLDNALAMLKLKAINLLLICVHFSPLHAMERRIKNITRFYFTKLPHFDGCYSLLNGENASLCSSLFCYTSELKLKKKMNIKIMFKINLSIYYN